MDKHTLVVEPSRTIRKLLEIYLQREGHYVAIFASHAEAIQALAHAAFQAQPPDLVFVAFDPLQPGSAGVIEQLRTRPRYAHTRIILMVAREVCADRQVQKTLQEARAIPLFKPFRIQDALALVSIPAWASAGPTDVRTLESRP